MLVGHPIRMDQLRPALASYAALATDMQSPDVGAQIENLTRLARDTGGSVAASTERVKASLEVIVAWPHNEEPGDLTVAIEVLDQIGADAGALAGNLRKMIALVERRLDPASTVRERIVSALQDVDAAFGAYLSALSELHWAFAALRAERQPAGGGTAIASTPEELDALLDSIRRGTD